MWTENQKMAIDAPVGNILVTAAAGSGKTAVMVERILKRVLDKDGVDIDKILVVTYTNAAASEIKERIQLGIMKKLEENPNDERLSRQLLLIDNAKICTIHSLCLDIIKKYFYKIDLDPSFRIGDTLEINDIKEKAINEVFEKYYDMEDEVFLNLVDEFCAGKKTDNALVDAVSKIYNFSKSMTNPKKWLNNSLKMYEDFEFSKHHQIVLDNIKNDLECARILCNNSISLCNKNNEQSCMKVLISDLDLITELIDNCNLLSNIYEKVCSIKFSVFSSSYKKEMSDFILKKVELNRDEIKKIIKKIALKITVTEKDFKQDSEKMSIKVGKLCEIAATIDDVFSQKKKEKNLIDFSDFEHFALKVLQDENECKTEEAKTLSSVIEEIYVDEYQDCNHIQDRIFYLLSNCDKDNPNIFMVGDVKQSIYKFRDAAPMLFLDKMNSYTQYDGGSGYSKISLSKNFRSRKEILNATNFIFKQIMSEHVGEVEYDDYLIENQNEEYKTTCDEFLSVDVAILSDISSDTIIDEDDEILENAQCEAHYVAQKINELVKSKVLIYDKSIKQKRPISYKDIVVLLRSTKEKASVYEEIFKKLSIPTFSDSSNSFFSSVEIKTILNYIKIVVNPIDDINLVSVLRSGIFMFTDDELLKIRLEERFDYFYYALIKYVQNNEDYLANKINKFLRITNFLKDESKYLATDEFIWQLLKTTDYLKYISTLSDSKEKKLNIRLLINKASQFESTDYKGIFNFTKFVDDIISRNNDTDAAKIVSENDDLVRIMSIHKSKGLEFPVVFLAGCGKKINFTDERTKVLCHKELGIGIDYVDYKNRFSYTPVVKKSIVDKLHLETLSEEQRVLYVALTRAREKLYICGIQKNIKTTIEKYSALLQNWHLDKLPIQITSGATSYFDWIIPSIMRHPNCFDLYDAETDIALIDSENSVIKCNIIPIDNYKKIEDDTYDAKEIIIPDKPSCLYEEVERKMSYIYEKTPSYLPTNVTVTELKKVLESSDKEYHYYQKEFVSTPSFKNNNSGAKHGTLIHTVLQYIDFKKCTDVNLIHRQIENIVACNTISADDINSIDITMIERFITSKLGKSICESEKVYKEFPFKIEENASDIFYDVNNDDKLIVQGVIDLFYYDSFGKLVLVDYKTDKLTEKEIKEKYSVQLLMYAKALKKITGDDVDKIHIYSFFNNKDIVL